MWEHNYLYLLKHVIAAGERNETRNGATRSVFGAALEIRDLEDGIFPILTTRKMYPEGIFGELAAFVRGTEALQTFKTYGCNYWDANAAAWPPNKGVIPRNQMVGRIYGSQWRDFNEKDQLQDLIDGLKRDPTSRRHVMTTFNPAEIDQGCLPPCHLLVQYSVRRKTWLESCVYMRSVDLCLGLPTDVVLYATLQVLLANELGLQPGAITFMLGDAHIYENHVDQLGYQLSREILPGPTYELADNINILAFYPSEIQLLDYDHYAPIAYPFNV